MDNNSYIESQIQNEVADFALVAISGHCPAVVGYISRKIRKLHDK